MVGTGNNYKLGYVKFYEYTPIGSFDTWSPKGNEIIIENIKDESVFPLTMNEDGTVLAVGGSVGKNTDGNILTFRLPWKNETTSGGTNGGTIAQDVGHVKVYQYSESSWILKNTIVNENAEQDQFGFSIAMDKDGKKIAISTMKVDLNVYDN